MKTLKYFNGNEVITMKQGENFRDLEFVEDDCILLKVDDTDKILIKSNYYEIENTDDTRTLKDVLDGNDEFDD